MSAHMKLLFLSCSFIFEVHENTHSFLYPFFFHIRQELGWPFCHKRGASTLPWRKHRLKTKLLSTHSNVALLSSSDISRRWAAINHPCVSWFSMIFATCLGLDSSKAVLMSMLAMYMVERTTLPCLNMRVLSSCHSQCFCSKYVAITTRCGQLIPFKPPTCSFFQFSGSLSCSKRRIIQDRYHFETTDVSAMAL